MTTRPDIGGAADLPVAARSVPVALHVPAARLIEAVRRRPGFQLGPVSLDVTPGRWTGLTGPSGAGKTTLLRLLAGLDRLDSGRLELFGEDVTRATEGRLAAVRRDGIGVVLQDDRLIEHLTVWRNVSARLVPLGVPARERRARAAAALEPLGALGLLDRLPTDLSGGERQRAAVARALVAAPRLLLADEPTAAVDVETADRVLEALAAARDRGTALLVSSHDPRVLAASEESWTIAEGRVRA